MAVTTSSTLSPLVNAYVQKKGLARAIPALIYGMFGLMSPLPTRNSNVYKWFRYERVAPTDGKTLATVRSIAEGVAPTPSTPTRTPITVTLAQYGYWEQHSDVVDWINVEDVKSEIMSVVSENMGQTIDCVYRDGIQGGTNVFRLTDAIGGVSGAARVNVAGIINAQALLKAVRNLERSDAKYYQERINAGTGFGTTSVRPAYVMLIGPDVKADLENVQGYKPVSDYGDPSNAMENEVGSWKNIRFVMSTLAKVFPDAGAAVAGTVSTSASNSDVYSCILVGKNAYACVDMKSAAEIIVNDQSTPSKVDPLNQYGTIGWKAYSASQILNDNWILRFECVATA